MKAKINQPLERIEEAFDDDVGFCRACGAERECCEPDAQNYKCDNCGALEVFGAEEFILRAWVS